MLLTRFLKANFRLRLKDVAVMSEQFEECGVSGGSWWRDRYHVKFLHPGILANLVTLAVLLACLFIPAGTLNYWQAWVFVAVFEGSAQALGIYFLIHDRKLVERRMNIGPVAEQRPTQKLISALFMLGFVGFVALPAFDHRFGWSPVAPVVSVMASAMIVLSFVLFFVVMQSNSYAASTIRVEEGQPVVSTGPYAYVRHPMYSGALLLLLAMPLGFQKRQNTDHHVYFVLL
jgi:protein-S-isoprenylcysteine O-methyltransferase Ste14